MNASFVSADSTEASIENAMRRGSYGEKIGGSADAHDQKTIENEVDESVNEQLPAVVTTDTNTSVDQNSSSDRKKFPLILDPFVTEEASKFFKNTNERVNDFKIILFLLIYAELPNTLVMHPLK